MFQGEHEQHFIAHAIMHAACIGPDVREECIEPTANLARDSSSSILLVCTGFLANMLLIEHLS